MGGRVTTSQISNIIFPRKKKHYLYDEPPVVVVDAKLYALANMGVCQMDGIFQSVKIIKKKHVGRAS